MQWLNVVHTNNYFFDHFGKCNSKYFISTYVN